MEELKLGAAASSFRPAGSLRRNFETASAREGQCPEPYGKQVRACKIQVVFINRMSRHQKGKPFIQVGVPLLLLTVGGSVGIAYLLQGKYTIKVGYIIVAGVLQVDVRKRLKGSFFWCFVQDAQDKASALRVNNKKDPQDLESELQVGRTKHVFQVLSQRVDCIQRKE